MTLRIQKAIGWTMLVMSSLGFMGILNKPPPSPGGAALVLGLMLMGGVGLVWPRKAEPATGSTTLAAEQGVLRTARALNGRVTAAEVAAETGLSLQAVNGELARLERDGACTSLVGESGILVYLFAEFENPEAKKDVFAGDEERRLREHSAAVAASQKQNS
jgi:hypothetical protein